MKQIFKEFYLMSKGDKDPEGKLKDILIREDVVMRLWAPGMILQFLTTGTYLTVPRNYLCLGIKLFGHSGDRILFENPPQQDKVDRFIYYLNKLSQWWVLSYSKVDSKDFLSTVSELCSIGTADFREYTKESFGLNLSYWELCSLNKNLLI